MSKYIKWFIEHRIFSLIGLLAAGITIYSFFGPSTANIDQSTIIINTIPPPRGRCGSGIADPQGWVGEVPECGEEGEWLYDCDRKAYIRNFLPTIKTVRETEKRIRECK